MRLNLERKQGWMYLSKMEGVNDVETFGRQLREEILRNGKTTQCIAEVVSAKQLGKNGVGNARLYK